jgi:hypothetical protein
MVKFVFRDGSEAQIIEALDLAEARERAIQFMLQGESDTEFSPEQIRDMLLDDEHDVWSVCALSRTDDFFIKAMLGLDTSSKSSDS